MDDTKSPEDIAFIVCKTLITIIGLVGNVITIITLALNPEGIKKVTRMVLQHQAIIDSFVCIMGVAVYTQKHHWMTENDGFNYILCHGWHSQAVFWGGVLISVWNIVLITAERFMLINYPFQHRDIRPIHLRVVFVLMYILSVGFLLPAYFFVTYDENQKECLHELYFKSEFYESFLKFFSVFWVFIVYIVPIIIQIGMYTKTIISLRQRRKEFRKSCHQDSHVLKLGDQQMTRTAIAVSVMFVIAISWDAWFYLIGIIDKRVEYKVNSLVQMVGVFLGALNSCANPFIYLAFLPCFRRSLKKTFRFGRQAQDPERPITMQGYQTNLNQSRTQH